MKGKGEKRKREKKTRIKERIEGESRFHKYRVGNMNTDLTSPFL